MLLASVCAVFCVNIDIPVSLHLFSSGLRTDSRTSGGRQWFPVNPYGYAFHVVRRVFRSCLWEARFGCAEASSARDFGWELGQSLLA